MCDTIPGDVGNGLHTVVTITQTVIKNAMHDNGWMEGKRKKKKERRNENGIQIHITKNEQLENFMDIPKYPFQLISDL